MMTPSLGGRTRVAPAGAAARRQAFRVDGLAAGNLVLAACTAFAKFTFACAFRISCTCFAIDVSGAPWPSAKGWAREGGGVEPQTDHSGSRWNVAAGHRHAPIRKPFRGTQYNMEGQRPGSDSGPFAAVTHMEDASSADGGKTRPPSGCLPPR